MPTLVFLKMRDCSKAPNCEFLMPFNLIEHLTSFAQNSLWLFLNNYFSLPCALNAVRGFAKTRFFVKSVSTMKFKIA